MTTGSYGGISLRPNPNGGCGAGGNEEYGTLVTWTGGDSLTPRRTKRSYTIREIQYTKTILRKGKKVQIDKIRRFRVYDQRVPPVKVPRYLPVNDFSKSWQKRFCPSVEYEGYDPGVQYGLTPSCFINPVPPSYPWNQSLDYKLVNKLQVKVQGSDFNLASFLGAEGHDTLKFVAETASRFGRSILAARRGNINKAISLLKEETDSFRRRKRNFLTPESKERQFDAYQGAAAEFFRSKHSTADPSVVKATAKSWMEWHLAAAPLLGDVKAAAEQLAHQLGPKGVRYSTSKEARSWVNIAPGDFGAAWLLKQTAVRKSLIYYTSEDQNSVPQLLGILDPEVVIWEAIPFSFVADWFIPIGNYLQARAFAASLTSNVCYSVKTETKHHRIIGLRVVGKGGFRRIDGSEVIYEDGSFVRSASFNLSGLVTPPKVIPLSEALSFSKALTAVSLVVQSVFK